MTVPPGIVDSGNKYTQSMDSIRIPGEAVIAPGRFHQNTFEFTEKHVQLKEKDKEIVTGVQFNVETVPDALPEHVSKPRLGRSDEFQTMSNMFAKYYSPDKSSLNWDLEPDLEPKAWFAKYESLQASLKASQVQANDIRIEAASKYEPNLIYAGGNGFFIACLMAFAQHLPLQLSPDIIWSLVTYAFAKHVDIHSEALRSKFVQHKGKKRLLVETPDSFAMSRNGDPDSGASAADWESCVFAQFSLQIRKHIGKETHDAITSDFSTMTPASRAAIEITLMSAMKNYFSYGCSTGCGIPTITLQGTEEDWVAVRKRTEELGNLMMDDFSSYWMPLLLPVLDEFVLSYQGEVNHGFWQSMVKLRNNGMDSGYREFISGWMQIFFPYLESDRVNKQLRPWNEMYFTGPTPDEFPSIISSVPVDWNYHGKVFNMDFHSVTSVRQDPSDGALAPVVGWYVTHSPPKPAAQRLADIKKEIDDLLEGHKDEVGEADNAQPWLVRVNELRREQAELEAE